MKKFVLLALVVFLLSFSSASIKTYKSAKDAHSLLALAAIPDREYIYNPYSNENSGFINPMMAEWILRNMEYPYTNCDPEESNYDCNIPLIMWACGGINLGNKQSEDRITGLIKLLISKGYEIDQYYEGMTALHESIIKNIPQCVSLLLNNGANPLLESKIEDKRINNKNAYELHDYMYSYSKDRNNRKHLNEVITKHRL